MRFLVLRKLDDFDCHLCKDSNGEIHRIDLTVGLQGSNESLETIVGKIIEVKGLYPILEGCTHVEVIPDGKLQEE